MKYITTILYFLIFSLLFSGCSLLPLINDTIPIKKPINKPIEIPKKKTIKKPKPKKKYTIQKMNYSAHVTATAYTSSPKETDSTPYLAAWNNRLRPGVKSIAVSRDLLKMGLSNGTKVRISGLRGTYKVLDKMNKRWKRKIDIYMGTNRKRAIHWGKKRVIISWRKKSITLNKPKKHMKKKHKKSS
jgi:3D (Asp-Asp-Asp) domain-containing protein